MIRRPAYSEQNKNNYKSDNIICYSRCTPNSIENAWYLIQIIAWTGSIDYVQLHIMQGKKLQSSKLFGND